MLLPQTFTTHLFAAPAQAAPFAPAQVFVVALQRAVVQTAVAFPLVQVPVCSPSLGMAAPAESLETHSMEARLQYWAELQSLST